MAVAIGLIGHAGRLPVVVFLVLTAATAMAATIEGRWLDMMGSVEVGGMHFDDADDIAAAIRRAGMPCGALIRLETLPSSLLATCDAEGRRYRLLPDAEGRPLVAPLD